MSDDHGTRKEFDRLLGSFAALSAVLSIVCTWTDPRHPEVQATIAVLKRRCSVNDEESEFDHGFREVALPLIDALGSTPPSE